RRRRRTHRHGLWARLRRCLAARRRDHRSRFAGNRDRGRRDPGGIIMAPMIKGLLFDKDGTLLDYEASCPPINLEAAHLAARGDDALPARLLRAGGAEPETGIAVADSLFA